MTTQQLIKVAVQQQIVLMMDRVMKRVLYDDPFKSDEHRANRPLYAALVPDEVFKASHFERRFVTPFGSVWEKVVVEVAKLTLGEAQTAYRVHGLVNAERLRRITEVLNRLEFASSGASRQRPDWNTELNYILEGEGKEIPVTVNCDVFAKNLQTGESYVFELKSPLPNSDISKVSKEKLFKLFAMNPRQVNEAYFALPYNPYGKREDYNWAFPTRWFDMKHDSVVLIGDEFWDKMGGTGTYKAFIDAVNEIAPHYKIRIYRELLGIEPPSTVSDKIIEFTQAYVIFRRLRRTPAAKI